jgi:hypothetical protein
VSWPRALAVLALPPLLVLLLLSSQADVGSNVDALRLDVTLVDGRVVWSRPAAAGERFDIVFTHSSERCRWVQHYVIVAAGALQQTGSAFPCFGPGMPSQPAPAARVNPSAAADAAPDPAAGAAAGAAGFFGRSRDGYEAAAPLRLDTIRMMNWRPSAITIRHAGREWPIGEAMDDYAAFTVAVR